MRCADLLSSKLRPLEAISCLDDDAVERLLASCRWLNAPARDIGR
jgi:hypothetical protein